MMAKKESGRVISTKIFYNGYTLQQKVIKQVRVMNRISDLEKEMTLPLLILRERPKVDTQ